MPRQRRRRSANIGHVCHGRIEVDVTLTGVPIHRHFTYGETMQAVQGSIGVVGHNGTKTMILSPESGESYTVKPGEWHRFFNPSPTEACIFEAKVRPAHQGFEILLHILYGLVDDGHGTPEGLPSSIFYLLMLNDMGDMGFPGFGGWLMGLVSKAARLLAWVTGEEERLIRKYYGRPITDEEKRKWKVT